MLIVIAMVIYAVPTIAGKLHEQVYWIITTDTISNLQLDSFKNKVVQIVEPNTKDIYNQINVWLK